jgi:hypothetical protein
MDKGKVTVGVSGDVAVLVGVKVDVSTTIDTNKVVQDANTVANATQPVVQQTTNVANTAVKETTNVVNNAGNAINDGAKKTGNAFKKAFRF